MSRSGRSRRSGTTTGATAAAPSGDATGAPSRAATAVPPSRTPAATSAHTAIPSMPQATSATPSSATSSATPVEVAGGAGAAAGTSAQTPRRPLARGLRSLTAAGVLACSLNGLAAYGVVSTDAARVQSVATAQATELGEVTTAIDSLGATARSTPVGGPGEEAYLTTVSTTSSRLASVTARAATGPAGLADDTEQLTALSADYTRYVALLESGRAANGTVAAERYRQGETIRTTRLDPTLAQLRAQNTDRSSEARTLAWVTMGGLGLTSLITLITLLGGSRWLASRTKRVVNPGLFGALVTSGAVSGYAFSQLGSATVVTPGAGPLLLVGGFAAAGLVWLGLDQRLKEYR